VSRGVPTCVGKLGINGDGEAGTGKKVH
jgi:hypothetical protein